MPSVLFLQIQRVVYDKEINDIKKISNPVSFDKVIYVDRFMLENRVMSSKIRAEVREYKKKVRILEQALEKFKNYGNDKLNLQNVMKTAVQFFSSQQNEKQVEEYDAIKVFDPNKIGDLGKGKECMENAIHFLQTFEKSIADQINAMEAQLKVYKEMVIHSYDLMKKNEYYLHSILIHAGQADSGHYYSFIFDFDQQKWRKYNDIQITEETEENVFQSAIGDPTSAASAYGLIYVSKERKMQGNASAPFLRQFSLTDSNIEQVKAEVAPEKIMDVYSSLLPPKLKKEVYEDNAKLENEISEFRAGSLVKKVGDTFNSRFETLMQVKDQKPFEKTYPLFNFICYLDSQKNPLFKWQLLDVTLKDNLEGQIGLEVLEQDDPIYKKLQSTFMKNCKNKPSGLILSKNEAYNLDVTKGSYIKALTEKTTYEYLVNNLLASKWESSHQAICFYMENKLYSNSDQRKKVLDIIKLLSLRFASLICEMIMKNDMGNCLLFTKLLSQLCIFYIDKDDPHTKHALSLLNYVFTEISELMTQEQSSEIAIYLEEIRTNNNKTKNVPTKKPPIVNVTIYNF